MSGSKINSFQERLLKILESDSIDLKDLATIAGYDPKTFYKFQDLSGCDLRGQNLFGIDFTGCNLDRARLDSRTKIDKIFDPRVENKENKIITIKISYPVQRIMNYSQLRSAYAYKAWAYKKVISYAHDLYKKGVLEDYLIFIHKSETFGKYRQDYGQRKSIKVLLTPEQYEFFKIIKAMRYKNIYDYVLIAGSLKYMSGNIPDKNELESRIERLFKLAYKNFSTY